MIEDERLIDDGPNRWAEAFLRLASREAGRDGITVGELCDDILEEFGLTLPTATPALDQTVGPGPLSPSPARAPDREAGADAGASS